MKKTPRKTSPTRQGDKRQEILDAARRTFLQKGLQGASIAAICEEAAISPGHLYHYFDSKDAILEAITEVYLADTRQNFGKRKASNGVIPAILAEIDRTIKRSANGNQALLFELIAEASRTPAIARILHESTRQQQALLSELIRNGKAEGEVAPELDPDVVASAIIVIIDALKIARTRGSDVDPAETARMMSAILARILAPQGAQ